MSGLVLKNWHVNQSASLNGQGAAIHIAGREGGLLAWILARVGVDPVTTLKVDDDRVEFSQASLSGTELRLIPLQSVCSTYYGYHKPWKVAATIILAGLFLGFSTMKNSTVLGLLILLLGLGAGAVYYVLNRTLTLGFVEASGVVNGIRFKRSVIENVDINAEEARKVCNLIQDLVERKQKRLQD